MLPWSDVYIKSDSLRGLKKFIKWLIPGRLHDVIWLYRKMFTKEALKKRRTLLFQVMLCEHCNLNCKGCASYSPLAPKEFLDAVSYEKDCARLSALCGGIAESIDLLGGEPLLHPEIIKIIEITRKNFKGTIKIVTNGLKLAAMGHEFWDACQRNNINIIITGYPINIDLLRINQVAAKYNVSIEMRGETSVYAKNLQVWTKLPLDLQGKQDACRNFLLCLSSNFCVYLKDGKIATCGQVFNVRHFNEYFNENMEIADENFIDIYKASSLDEILEFISRPIPFCKYCGIKKIKRGIKWETSKREITEWT
jgi:MoaA/NifB/PqqE/SkfB family radical SAM enzyme